MHKVTSVLVKKLFEGGRLFNNGKDEGLSIMKLSMDYDILKRKAII